MSIQQVKSYFQQFGMESRVRELPESSATVELAAQALGTQPARIAKTLSFLVGEEPILIVAAGDVENRQRQVQGPLSPKGQDALSPLGAGAHRPSGGRRVPLAVKEGGAGLSG